ncbi:sporulation protein YjcZ [Paenibacillus septentrionalis]|uniref:Sporulation protein YjcZ n=1 Tax=Paenibacillus septentrionalis TaxID=429342 RepID=A0ABW1V7G5_9BACL
MNYAAKVSGANQAYGGKGVGGFAGVNAGWILVLFILLVLLVCFC